MSSGQLAYDQKVFEDSSDGIEPTEFVVQDVQRLEIVDSNNGAYSAGQVRFNCLSLATADRYIDWKKSHLVIPLQFVINGPNASIAGASLNAHLMCALKNGFYSVIDSISCSINNVEVVSRQSYLHMVTQFNLMTSMNRTDVDSIGPSIGFHPDSVDAISMDAARGEINNICAYAPSVAANAGNVGRTLRAHRMVTNLNDPHAAAYIGTAARCAQSFRSHLEGTAANTNALLLNIEAVIPLRYLHPLFEALPTMRGAALTLLVNTHCPATVALTTSVAGAFNAGTTPTVTTQSTNYLPFTISENFQNATAAANAFTFNLKIGNSMRSSCVLRFNALKFNPEYESKLIKSPVKRVVFQDYMSFIDLTTSVASGTSVNQLLNVNLPRLRKLVMFARPTAAGTNLSNLALSPFSQWGATVAPMPITNVQVLVGGRPIYTTPRQMGWEEFLLEMEGVNGIDGNATSGMSCGLLDRDSWERGYMWQVIDLSRHTAADDLLERAPTVQFTNNSAISLNISYLLFYEREFSVSVTDGKVVI